MTEPRSWYPDSSGGYADLHAGLVKNGVHAILVDSDGAPSSPVLKEIFGLLQERHCDGDRTAEMIDLTALGEGQDMLDFTPTGRAPLDGQYATTVPAKDLLLSLRAFRLQSLTLINKERWLTPDTLGGDAMPSRVQANRWTRWIVTISARDLQDCEGNIGMFLCQCRAAGISVIVKTDAATLAAETPFKTSLLDNCPHAILTPGSGVPNGPRNDTEDLQFYWHGMQREPEPRPSFWRRWFSR